MSPSREAASPQLLQNFPVFCGTRKFITVVTGARHWSLSWDRWVESMQLRSISLRSILILISHLSLGLLVVSFLPVFPPNICRHSSSLMRATYRAQHFFLHLLILIIFDEGYKRRSSLWNCLHPPLMTSHLDSSILLSNSFSICSSLYISHHVWHPCKGRGKFIDLKI
jgi:hypothetical protein